MRLRVYTLLALLLTQSPASSIALAQQAERSPREIQQALSDKGFKVGTIDGVWGKRSTTALKAFQSANGINATGKVDQPTIDALFPPPTPPIEPTPAIVESEQDIAAPDALAKPAEVAKPELVEPITPVIEAPLPIGATAAADANQPKPLTPLPSVLTSDPQRDGEKASASPVTYLILVASVIGIIALFGRRKKKLAQPEQESATPATAPKVALKNLRPISRATLDADNDTLTVIVEPNAPQSLNASLAAHDASIKSWIMEKAGSFGTREPDVIARPVAAAKVTAAPSSSSGWLAKGTSVSIGGITIPGGMIYVGSYLAKQGRPHEMENCLIDPKLKVGRSGDVTGSTMGYWPSYVYMTPEARRSYLEWLASDRSDPSTYIGFVFLYFYGLERRLLLEKDAPDAAILINEVRRLVDVYGGNHSFNRYAMELLTATELRSGEPSAQFLARVEPNGFEVPTAVKIALGVRVRDNRPIEASLLLRFAMTHPETRVRTPARRAPELLLQLYAEKYAAEYPEGYRYKAGRSKALQKRYKACSGSFEVDIDVLGGGLPDITHRAEPIGTARRIFDACTEALDDYSRVLGKLDGLKPNLLAVSKLPASLRLTQAKAIEGRPLERLEEFISATDYISLSDIARVADFDAGASLTKAKLRDLSQLLSAFGYGVTFDPAFATKTASASDPAVLFRLSPAARSEPTSHYRSAQLSLMLGLMVGLADGEIHESERASLLSMISSVDGLDIDDRTRLEAELKLHEAYPQRLDDWMKKLKDIPGDAKESVAAELVSVASADGSLHAAEIKKLETIFKRMGLDQSSLYERLHAGSSGSRMTSGASPAPPPSSSASPARIDLSRLQSIRSETSLTANVLADIFADEETSDASAPVAEPLMEATETEMYEGLEQRYGSLLNELRARSSWSAQDFDHLARDAGLMPGAAREKINDWSFDVFDEAIIEGEDPVEIAVHLLPPSPPKAAAPAEYTEGMPV